MIGSGSCKRAKRPKRCSRNRRLVRHPFSEVGPTVKTARKPRVLPMISPLVPVLLDESETAIALSPPAGEIPRSQLARIRAWVKYGMTIAQVAQVCGVAVAEIERILRYPSAKPAPHR